MPLLFHHDNSFDNASDLFAQKDDNETQRILSIDDEESCHNAFQHRDAVYIRISSDLGDIDEGVFEGFTDLRQVRIPNSVRSIGDNAFAQCESLTEIFLPDSIEWIGCAAFSGCSSLTAVHLPIGVKDIESDTFLRCTSLKEIFLPPSVQRIGDGAFAECKNLEAIYGGEGLIAIESEAFFGCKKLRHFSLNSSVCSVADDAFGNSPFCLPATYFGPQSPRSVYGKNVVVPSGVQTIGACAFSSQNALKSITLPDSVRNISRGAFDLNFSDLDSYHSSVTEDTIKRLPQEMNMPAGYLRQQTPFDAMMALALSATVWKYAVTDEDYEAMALYCDDPEARYSVMQRLSDFPSTHLERMMELPRVNISHLNHLAEFICMYFPSLATYDDDITDIVKELHQEARDRGAADAARILERYCLYPELYCNDDGMTGMYEYTVSPYEAEIILQYDYMFRDMYLGENDLHFADSRHRVPSSYLHVIFAEYMKPDVLRTLMPYRADEIEKINTPLLQELILRIEEDEWIRFLKANEETSFNALRLLCISADRNTLTELYEEYRAKLADAVLFQRMMHLSELYDAVSLNNSDDAILIGERLKEDIEEVKKEMIAYARSRSRSAEIPMFTEGLWDDADRWRMLNELDDDYPFAEDGEPPCDDSGDARWASLFTDALDESFVKDDFIEDDPFADFGEFADFDEDTEEALDQLDDDEWGDWEEYDADQPDDDEWGD